MNVLLAWWNGLPTDTQQKIIVGLVTAIGTAFLTLFVPKVVWPAITKVVNFLKEKTYELVAGWTIFNWWGLNRYKVSLKKTLERVVNPWSSQKLLMGNVFVPVKVDKRYVLPQFGSSHKSSREPVDLSSAVEEYRRFVLVGDPGGGKSTALKSIGLSILENKLLRDKNKLPVFIELRKFASIQKPLNEYLIDVFMAFGFPNADNFIKRKLIKGELILLLDGLDEVREDRFSAVIESIRRFYDEYYETSLIVTCRIASYDRQIDDLSDATVALENFNDIQITTFLRHWLFPGGKTPVELMRSLRERPRILSICRNPLLLTIVTSLYIETDYEIPSSRAEFYATCVDAVMKKWDSARNIERYNKFRATAKMKVLQAVAWTLHSMPNSEDDIDYEYLVKFIEAYIPSIGLTSDAAEDIVLEIVRNSGLLLFVAPKRLRFAHLTFKEYFVALHAESSNTNDELIKFFTEDSKKWREVVLLYCGIARNPTPVIFELLNLDPSTAGNCIAEAETVDVALASRTILRLFDEARSALYPDRELRALSLMAADSRKTWGKEAFHQLVAYEDYAHSPEKLTILLSSFTNIPTLEAAQYLAKSLRQETTSVVAQKALVQIGAISLPVVKNVIESTDDIEICKRCLEICMQISAPEVVEIILPMLKSTNPGLRATSAWAMGVVLRDPTVEQAIKLMKPAELSKYLIQNDEISELANWLWPFNSNTENFQVNTLVANIIFAIPSDLILDLIENYGRTNHIDRRLGLPLAIVHYSVLKPDNDKLDIMSLLESLKPFSLLVYGEEYGAIHADVGTASKTSITIESIDISSDYELFSLPSETLRMGWKNLFAEPKMSWQDKTSKLLQYLGLLYTCIIVLVSIFTLFTPSPSLAKLISILNVAMVSTLSLLWNSRLKGKRFYGFYIVPASLGSNIEDSLRHRWRGPQELALLIASSVYAIASPFITNYVLGFSLKTNWVAYSLLVLLVIINVVPLLTFRQDTNSISSTFRSILNQEYRGAISAYYNVIDKSSNNRDLTDVSPTLE